MQNDTNKDINHSLDLHYFCARYYNASQTTFISADPVGGKVENPLSWNRYLYCRNDPINYIDPDGRDYFKALRFIDPGGANFLSVVARKIESVVFYSNIVLDEEQHYARNKLNKPADDLPDAVKNHRELSPSKSVYHRQGPGNEKNRKFVSQDGHHETVFKDGEIVAQDDDPVNAGTYNHFDPEEDPVLHFVVDVVPFYEYGNTPNDPTNFVERVFVSYDGGEEDSSNGE